MTTTTFTSRQFNHDTGRAKRAAEEGPVFITHRGHRSHVLLTIERYERLAGREASIVDQLAMEGAGEIAFEPAKLTVPPGRPADLS